jgi:methylated-DNA-protein-cysteine methyltransferase related protein
VPSARTGGRVKPGPAAPDDLTDFEAAVAAVLLGLRRGDVVTYGEVAEEAGYPRRARAVGRFLATHDGYPWWRVVTSNGRLVPHHERRHAELLAAEGVAVRDGRVSGMLGRARH